MSYARLYEAIRSANLPVKRNVVKDEVLRFTGVSKVKILATTLDATVCRGMYLTPQNTSHKFTSLHGQHVIAFARHLNRCWQRLVIVKELMHMLDGAGDATDTGAAFDLCVTEMLNSSPAQPSAQTVAESRAFWMALGILVPDHHRLRLRDKWAREAPSDADGVAMGIALEARVPVLYVPLLLSDRFEQQISDFR